MKKLLYLLLLTPIIYLVSCSKSNVTPTTNTPHTYINHPNSALTIIPDANFEQVLIDLGYDNNLNGSVYTAMINEVTRFAVNSWDSISDLTGIENFTALDTLHCESTQLTSLYLSRNTALTYLNCDFNQLTSLDLSSNTALLYLQLFNNNQLTSLDVSGATALTYLNCSNNQLTSLDLSSNTALTSLNCYSNQLTSLDLSSNTALTFLNCGSNQLTSLDLASNTDLFDLSCRYNQLTSLDVSNNTALVHLGFRNNPYLNCINVANFQYAYDNWYLDTYQYFSEDCP